MGETEYTIGTVGLSFYLNLQLDIASFWLLSVSFVDPSVLFCFLVFGRRPIGWLSTISTRIPVWLIRKGA